MSFLSESMNQNRMSMHRSAEPPRPHSSMDFPSEDQLLVEIKRIITSSNLMNITKKQIRERLSETFGGDFDAKKEYINSLVDYLLASLNH